MEHHADFGLMSGQNTSHINAALQMLLHNQCVLSFILNDTAHRLKCRSLICICCALYRLHTSIAKKKLVQATFFIERWKRISKMVHDDGKGDPYEVLFSLITGLRIELVRRDAAHGSFQSTVVSKLFRGAQEISVSCTSCGSFKITQEFLSIEISDLTNPRQISETIQEQKWSIKHKPCSYCNRLTAQWKPLVVQSPPWLIVNFKRCVMKVEHLFQVAVNGEEYTMQSCATKQSDIPQCVFTSVCPDGVVRRFQNAQVNQRSMSTFLLQDVPHDCSFTALYKKRVLSPARNDSVVANTVASAQLSRSESKGGKVFTYPKTTDRNVLMAGLSGKRTIGTQTDPPPTVKTAEIGVQNDLIDYCKFKADKKCKLQFWTGLCAEDFDALYDLIGGDEVVLHLKQKYRLSTPKKKHPSRICGKNRLLMFLLRLRRGLPLEEIAYLFNISVSYAGELCYVMTCLLFESFEAISSQMFANASAKDQCKKKPRVMKPFKDLRVILDGVSIPIQTPSNFEHQGNTYSSYKHRNVIIFIVGISCQGATIFCTTGMEGSMSEKIATMKSELSKWLSTGDAVMTDKGFELTPEMEALGVKVLRPPIRRRGKCFTKEEENLTKAIAAARIYVEHAMAEIKDNRLLQGEIPLTMLPVLSKIVFIAAYLRNFSVSRVHSIKMKAAEAAEVAEDDVEDLICKA